MGLRKEIYSDWKHNTISHEQVNMKDIMRGERSENEGRETEMKVSVCV